MTVNSCAVGIVTDSTADLPPGLQERCNVGMVPLTVSWGNETFHDKVDLSTEQFYARLRTSKDVPRTGAPSLGAFESVFREKLETHEKLVSINLSGSLSGTFRVAEQAAKAVAPDRIVVIDSGTLTISLGWMVERAAELAEQGASLPDIQRDIDDLKPRMHILATLETLQFLQRGGRIGRGQALAGTLLNVKPIISVDRGEVRPVERVRSFPAALRRIVELTAQLGDLERVGVMHGDAPKQRDEIEQIVRQRFPHMEVDRGEIGSVLSVHAGPGVVGVASMTRAPA